MVIPGVQPGPQEYLMVIQFLNPWYGQEIINIVHRKITGFPGDAAIYNS